MKARQLLLPVALGAMFVAGVAASAQAPRVPGRASDVGVGGVARPAATPDPNQPGKGRIVRETVLPNGTRIIERVVEPKTEKLLDGTEVKRYDNGVIERKLPDGTLVQSFPSGQVQTLYPDGRKLIETDAKNADGKTARMSQLSAKDGAVIETRLFTGGRIQVTYPDKTFAFEYAAVDEKGAKLTLIERYDASGHMSARELVKADGRKRSGDEEWTIKRWVRSEDDATEVETVERYGRGGSVLKQDVAEESRRKVGAPAPEKASQ